MRNFLRIISLVCIVLTPGLLCLLAQQVHRADSLRGSQIEVDLNGAIVILDSDRNTLTQVSRELVVAGEIGGSGWEDDQFDRPSGVWARNGINVFVADYGNHRIQRFDRNLNFVSSLSTRERDDPAERFGYPTDVALSRLGELYICDGENARIVKVDRSNRVERSFGGFDAGEGRLHKPRTIEIGPKDRVYVLDGARIMVFDSFGNFIHQVADGMFQGPTVMFADQNGLVALNSDMMYCFDGEDRLRKSVPLESVIAEGAGTVRSMAFAAGRCYLLTEGGLFVAGDPRAEERLE